MSSNYQIHGCRNCTKAGNGAGGAPISPEQNRERSASGKVYFCTALGKSVDPEEGVNCSSFLSDR